MNGRTTLRHPTVILLPSALASVLLAAAAFANDTPAWLLKSPAQGPAPRMMAAMAYDAARGEIVLFGGTDNGALNFNDTWTWNGTAWTLTNPANRPPRRYYPPTLAYDASRGEIVLFGGKDSSGAYLNDTWVWDGTNWTQRTPVHRPAGRDLHSMAYDGARGEVVLFGGLSGNTSLNDTWIWNGTDWAQKQPANSPSVGSTATMAYDAARQEIVLYHGHNVTWTWNGSNWTQKSPSNSPGVISYPAIAYDAQQNLTLLFGGMRQDGTFLPDTWAWNGANWTQLVSTTAPAPRTWHTMAYDEARQEVVLFGGSVGGASPFSGETWVWTSHRPPNTPGQLISAWASGHATLSWVDRSDDEAGFEIERRNDPSGTYSVIANLSTNINFYVDTTSTDTSSYCYRVRAKNSAGASAYSNESCLAGSAGTSGQSLQFSNATYTITSFPSDPAITITRSGGTQGTITVNLLTGGGTASQGEDYTVLMNGAITFAPGEANKVIYPVRVRASGSTDSRTIQLKLSRPTGTVAIGSPGTAIVRIEPAVASPIEVLDAACLRKTAHVTCAGEFLNDAGLPKSLAALETMNVRRAGAAADGVSLLLLRIRSASAVTFALRVGEAVATSAYGSLLAIDGTNGGSSLHAVPQPTDFGPTVYALYLAPVDLPPSPSALRVVATPASGTPQEVSVTLTAPPVVLLHGLWSSADAFADPARLADSLYAYLVNRGFHVVTAAYSDDPAGSFDPLRYSTPILALSDATDSALRKARARGFAAAQVDVVAHSMGGLVARARATGAEPEGFTIMRSPAPYRRPENRGQGEIHKLITIGTPHQGTPAASWFLEHRCDPVNIGGNLEDALALARKPIGKAIDQLQPSHDLLRRIANSTVPTHTIAARAPVTSFTEMGLDILLAILGLDASADSLVPGYEDDLIVPLTSQRAGRASGIGVTSIDDTIHSDFTGKLDQSIAEPTNPAIHALVFALLQGRRVDWFTAFSTPPISGSAVLLGDCPNGNVTRESSSDSAELTPAAGTIVRPRDTVLVRFTVPNTGADQAAFTIAGGLTTVEGTGGVFTLSYEIPASAAGKLEIAAMTGGAGGAGYAANTFVTVLPANPPELLVVSPGALAFDLPDATAQLIVTGQYPDRSMIELTGSTAGTQYATESGTTAVVSVDADGRVTARGNGEEIIVIRNGTLTAAVGVVVDIANRRPIIAALAERRLHPGAAVNMTVSASDPDGHAIRLTSLGMPPFVTLTDHGNGTGTLSLLPGNGDAGDYAFSVIATDTGTPPLGVSRTAQVTVYSPFTDSTLSTGVTPIRLAHIMELRSRVDALRTRFALPAFAWTEPALMIGFSMKAQHVLDLRLALRDIYQMRGLAMPVFDSTVGTGTLVRAAHVQELRAALTAVE